jgi:hypothetical protein
MIAMFHRRSIGIFPILIAAKRNTTLPPNDHSHVVVAIQERVDKREKPKHCDNPIVKAREDCAILLAMR